LSTQHHSDNRAVQQKLQINGCQLCNKNLKKVNSSTAVTHLVMLMLKLGSRGEFMEDHMSVKVADWYLADETPNQNTNFSFAEQRPPG
jgi:hypothetical protein